jgi:hypothetical protein
MAKCRRGWPSSPDLGRTRRGNCCSARGWSARLPCMRRKCSSGRGLRALRFREARALVNSGDADTRENCRRLRTRTALCGARSSPRNESRQTLSLNTAARDADRAIFGFRIGRELDKSGYADEHGHGTDRRRGALRGRSGPLCNESIFWLRPLRMVMRASSRRHFDAGASRNFEQPLRRWPPSNLSILFLKNHHLLASRAEPSRRVERSLAVVCAASVFVCVPRFLLHFP